MRYLLFTFALLCSISFLTAQKSGKTYTVDQVPDPKNRNSSVSDPDDYLSASDEVVLNQLINAMEDSTTAQAAVVVLSSIGEDNPKEFATRLFNKWGIGQAEKDNGLLILTVMDQRRTEFETGLGTESILTDAICYRVGMQELVPHFQKGDYGVGLIAAVNKFKYYLENPNSIEEIKDQTYQGSGNKGGWLQILFGHSIFNGIFNLLALVFVYNGLNSKQDAYDKYMALRKSRMWFFLILFPIPYIFIWWFVGRKMKELRYGKRYSKKTGAELRLIPEKEEDAYLEKGQITEEEIGVADYDVWANDDDGEDLLILRYSKSNLKYRRCPKCNYITYYNSHSQTIISPTYSSTGLKEVVNDCKSCNYHEVKRVTIPMLTRSSSSSGSSSGGGGRSWGGGSSGGGGGGVSW
ncbi:MAG: TPM domain-containing protein [Haliscomenobacter sp.]|uniref:TPM domain-containing protein n=1 Tax=Haliscomenobacter sp. TaxID=2717303 RepID=UPI0029A0BF2C|nr:TPM domain-containing protein [Haliscomenobacter sp.]MDX2070619.1 TPM domain-containing protein [Haliscomenobacter sp.]